MDACKVDGSLSSPSWHSMKECLRFALTTSMCFERWIAKELFSRLLDRDSPIEWYEIYYLYKTPCSPTSKLQKTVY